MKRLLGAERVGGRDEYWYLHTGDDGKDRITVETIQDVEPVFDYVKLAANARGRKGDIRYKATIPFTMVDDLAKTSAALWGVSVSDAFAEIMGGKSDRAQKALRVLTDGRDYRKLQAP